MILRIDPAPTTAGIGDMVGEGVDNELLGAADVLVDVTRVVGGFDVATRAGLPRVLALLGLAELLVLEELLEGVLTLVVDGAVDRLDVLALDVALLKLVVVVVVAGAATAAAAALVLLMTGMVVVAGAEDPALRFGSANTTPMPTAKVNVSPKVISI
jgi:hypothetical protein